MGYNKKKLIPIHTFIHKKMTKKSKEFQNLSTEEIKSRINELRKELMKENVQVYSGTAPPNPGRLKQIKKNIARLLSITKQKEVKIG